MKYFGLFLAVVLFAATAFSQTGIVDRFYYVPLAQNVTDTIPGTQTGGGGNGACGWLYIGMDNLEYSAWAVDSVNFTISIDYSDTGVSPGSGSSANSTVPYLTATRTVGEDSIDNSSAGAPTIVTNVVRDRAAGVNKIEGGKWVRFRVVGINAAKFAAVAADRTIRLRIRTWKQ